MIAQAEPLLHAAKPSCDDGTGVIIDVVRRPRQTALRLGSETPDRQAIRLWVLPAVANLTQGGKFLVVDLFGVRSPRIVGKPRAVGREDDVIGNNHSSSFRRRTDDG